MVYIVEIILHSASITHFLFVIKLSICYITSTDNSGSMWKICFSNGRRNFYWKKKYNGISISPEPYGIGRLKRVFLHCMPK
jgi:hypothetical protein